MYYSIVRSKIRKAFESVNKKDYAALMPGLAAKVRHSFAGDHSLGGVRSDRQHLLLWFQRLGIVIPNLRLSINKIYVRGLPHDTTAIAIRTAAATLANGDSYCNRGVHIINIKWGKIVSLDVFEDSQAVAIALEKQVMCGVKEAGLPQIAS